MRRIGIVVIVHRVVIQVIRLCKSHEMIKLLSVIILNESI